MKLNRKIIRKLILEQMDAEFEELEADEAEDRRIGRDSVDDQIDLFLMRFENESMTPEDQIEQMSESAMRLSLVKLLLEQPAEEEPAGEEAPAEPAEEPEAPEEEAGEAAEEPPKPPIDVDAFTKRVARLVMNNDVLLDIKSAIVNRAMNFLFENYDQAHADEMKELLGVLDLGIGGEELPPERPFAAGAYAGGTGGGGGG
jgi:iron-sulfur cluster repair protein YtfE (RIC family)